MFTHNVLTSRHLAWLSNPSSKCSECLAADLASTSAKPVVYLKATLASAGPCWTLGPSVGELFPGTVGTLATSYCCFGTFKHFSTFEGCTVLTTSAFTVVG